jgi:hypothetical protein
LHPSSFFLIESWHSCFAFVVVVVIHHQMDSRKVMMELIFVNDQVDWMMESVMEEIYEHFHSFRFLELMMNVLLMIELIDD